MIYINYYRVREQPEENSGSLNVEGWKLHLTNFEFWVDFFLDFDEEWIYGPNTIINAKKYQDWFKVQRDEFFSHRNEIFYFGG